MQIACQRFSCQKAVEVCYWSCKFRGKCKDWQKATTGEPGLVAIQSRLESAAAKTGRAFDPQTLASPVRVKRSSHPLTKSSGAIDQPATVTVSLPTTPHAPVDAAAAHPPVKAVKEIKERKRVKKADTVKEIQPKIQPMNNAEETKPVSKAASNTTKAKPAPRSKPATTNGTLYLLLYKNGKYKELRESDLVTHAPLLLKDKSLRLVKGQMLVPTISFTTNEE